MVRPIKYVLLALFPSVLLSADAPISLAVSPIQQFAPGTVTYTIHVEPHRDNVQLCWGWDNQDSYRRSCQQLNGIYSPRLYQEVYQHLAPGHYSAIAEVWRAPAYLAAKTQFQFNVIDNH